MAEVDAARAHLQQYLPYVGTNGASNSWVVSGSLTKTGKPFLANDPHLELTAPNVWWFVHLSCPTVDMIGTSMAGMPGILIGHNQNIAWGFTMVGGDEQDLFIMEDNAAGTHYRYNGTWEPYTFYTESIRRGESYVQNVTVRVSRYGPAINHLYSLPSIPTLCMYWNSMHENDTSSTSVYLLNNAKDFTSFTEALRLYRSASINVVYADTSGNIGYQMTGHFRIRAPGHDGRYPVPGNGSFDYVGWIPWSESPRLYNPAEGFIVTANNKAPPPNYPYIVTLDWEEPARAERIRQMLSNMTMHSSVLTLTDMKAIQLDVVSGIFALFKPTLARIQPLTDRGAVWQRQLLLWDGVASIGSKEASVFSAWYIELSQLTLSEGFQSGHSYQFLASLFNSTDPRDDLCESLGMTCLMFAAKALEDALDILQVSDENSGPRWGVDIHQAEFHHLVLGGTPLSCISNRRTAKGGDEWSLNVAGWSYDARSSFPVREGPSWRMIVDLGNMQNSVYVCPLCGSGNMLVDAYSVQLEAWTAGQYFYMATRGFVATELFLLVPPTPPQEEVGML
eukprot:TRINITY_DN4014_c0_g1_i1.p1 TRINITY_DN4014_c0_g1~~TRINITY_DN4014_c0_g1_i1.p1  ORF type:complete len:584 (-),score=95.20 TRINITY_DN4014_c0_g1_i1:1303-2991(-)